VLILGVLIWGVWIRVLVFEVKTKVVKISVVDEGYDFGV
jgi:hypothetical protein